MADLKKTVELIFGGVDKTGSAVNSVGKNLDSLTNRVGSLTGPLADITDSILKLDTILAAAAVGVTGYAVKLADDFDTAFAEIATIIGQPADNLRDFQAQILEYSERSSASLSEITNATYGAISAGVDYSNSLELIAAAEQLAIAGKADLGSTTTALVSTMNAFGASADEAGAYADTFFTAVQLGQTTIPELSSAIGRLAPIAAAAGLSFDEMAAAIATITAETGTSTKEAITGIRAAINSLLKPSADASSLAEELGLEFNAAALESKGFSGVLEEVAKATGGNTELMARLFGSVEALAPVLALTGNASEKFASNLKAFGENAGAAGQASKELESDLGRIVQTLQNNLNSALIGFGSSLTNETQSIVTSVTSIFNSLGDELKLEDGVFAPILNGLEGLAQDIDAKLKTIAENFPEALAGIDVSELLAAFSDLGDEVGDLFSGLFGNIDLTTVDGLQSAMQKVVDAFTALVNISSGIADGLEPLFTAIGKGIEEFDNLDEGTKKNIGQILGFGKAVDTVLPAIGGLAGGLESVGNGITALAGAQGFKAVLSNLNSVKTLAAGAGKFGLIGTALIGSGAIGYELGSYINEVIEDNFGSIGSKIFDYLNEDEIALAEAQWQGYASEVRRAAEDSKAIREINESLSRTLGETTVATEEQQNAWQKYADELVNAANSGEDVADSQRGVAGAVEDLNQVARTSGGALDDVSRSTQKLAENNASLQLGYDEAAGKVNSFSGTIVKSSKALEDNAKKTEDAIRKTAEFQLELEKLASDERIAQIEASVRLDIAEVEANADKVKAIADSISDTFADTGKLINDLFGGYDDATRSTQIELSKQIKLENERRDEALAQQKELTQAEIEYIRQKTESLAKGEALINVEANNLAPALELIFYEILQRTQIRASEEGLDLLVGL